MSFIKDYIAAVIAGGNGGNSSGETAKHTHPLSDIEEVETTTTRTVVAEGKARYGNLTDGFVDSEMWNSLKEGQRVILTVGDEEYEGTYIGIVNESLRGTVHKIDAGTFCTFYGGSASIAPDPVSGTTVKLETVETSSIIPAEYISDDVKVTDAHINELIDNKAVTDEHINALIDEKCNSPIAIIAYGDKLYMSGDMSTICGYNTIRCLMEQGVVYVMDAANGRLSVLFGVDASTNRAAYFDFDTATIKTVELN